MQLGVQPVEVVGLRRSPHQRVQLTQPVQHPALQLGQVIVGNGLRGLEIAEIAEDEAQ